MCNFVKTFSPRKSKSPIFTTSLPMFQKHILWVKGFNWYLNQPDRTRGSGFFTQNGVKLAQKCSERWDLQLCENFLTPKIKIPIFTQSLPKCFKNTFYKIKAAFWYLNQPDRTSGSGFFTQNVVKLAQKCSERWDLQLCESSLIPKIKIHNFHPTSPNVSKTHFPS